MSQESEMLTDYDQGKRLAGIALAKIRREDIIHRGFLRPLQIALKARPSETFQQQHSHINADHHSFLPDEETHGLSSPNSLPCGLRIAVKHSICDNRYALRDVFMVSESAGYESLKEANQDNILSLMKTQEGLELAICVCMYSEDKKMLKGTLAGIGENIANLALRCAIDPDRIGVFVIMDGIEKVDSSVVDYFMELERSSGINLGQNLPPSLTIDQVSQRAAMKSEEEINEEQLKNINNFLFNATELQDRNQRSFPTVKAEYQEIRQLMATIQTLKKKKTLFDDLPAKARPFFFAEARELKKKMAHLSEREAGWLTEDRLIEQFALDIRRARPLIIKALQECERYCKEYIQSREDLAYLGTFRSKIRLNLRQDEEEDDEGSKLAPEGTERKLLDEPHPESIKISMNLFFCVKYKNSGKLSSHNWFFNGFCRELKPRFAVLLDVGLKPDGEALFKMYNYMRSNPDVGGVCGYMSLKIEQLEEQEQSKLDDVDFLSKICLKVADIQRTQQVEYHFAHLMDKAFEASFGFIHVLPGAFSAYNMAAIMDYNKPQDDTLLRAYFKSIEQKLASTRVVPSELSFASVLGRVLLPTAIGRCFSEIHPESEEQMLYNENIYLAEDRILCMGIHRKHFTIRFLPDAYAEVDPIKTVHGLLGQRKRWINGSFFAFERVKRELSYHEEREGVEACLNLQILYLTMMNSLAYFAPAFFLFTVHIAMDAFRADILTSLFSGLVGDPNSSQILINFVYFMDFVYVMLVGAIIYYSLHLTNGSKHFKPYIYAISTLLGIFSVSVFIVLAVDVFRGLIDNSQFLIENQALVGSVPGGLITIDAMRWILIASTLIFSVPVVSYVILFRKFHIACEVMVGAFSFLFYGPTYLNILNIYALCRIDDISWGTKGLDAAGGKNNKLKEKWYLLKMVQVGKFLLWNTILGVVLLAVGADYQPRFFITLVMVSVIALTLSLKVLIALGYMLGYKLAVACGDHYAPCPEGLAAVRHSRIDTLFDLYSEDVLEQVRAHLLQLAHRYNSNNYQQNPRSFISLSRNPSIIELSQHRQRQEFANRSQLSHQLSYIEGLTQKKPSNNSNYNIRLLNEYNLPIETRNALDVLSQMQKRQSALSLDKHNSAVSFQKRPSFSLEKRPSLESMDKKIQGPSQFSQFSQFSLDKRNSQPSLEKKSSGEIVEKRTSKPELEKKNSMHSSIKEEEEQSLEGKVEGEAVIRETIGEENESDEHSLNQLIPDAEYPLVPDSVQAATQPIQIRPKRKLETVQSSRFKPQEK